MSTLLRCLKKFFNVKTHMKTPTVKLSSLFQHLLTQIQFVCFFLLQYNSLHLLSMCFIYRVLLTHISVVLKKVSAVNGVSQ